MLFAKNLFSIQFSLKTFCFFKENHELTWWIICIYHSLITDNRWEHEVAAQDTGSESGMTKIMFFDGNRNLETPLRHGGTPPGKMGILILQAIVPSAPFRAGVKRGMYVFIRDWSYRSLFLIPCHFECFLRSAASKKCIEKCFLPRTCSRYNFL